jgi:hypothetical protein
MLLFQCVTAGNKQLAVFYATLVVVWYCKNSQFLNVWKSLSLLINLYKNIVPLTVMCGVNIHFCFLLCLIKLQVGLSELTGHLGSLVKINELRLHGICFAQSLVFQ